MSMWGAFANSTSAMIAQNSALNTISQNLANVNTNAYKRIDTRFATMLSESVGGNLDIFGVRNTLVSQIDAPGQMTGTGNDYDMAIQGGGFFILNTQADGGGETLFSRDGAFEKKAIDADGDGTAEAYLVDRNGYFVQGWQAAADGSITATGSLGSLGAIRIPDQMSLSGVASTTLTLSGNVPAGETAAQAFSADLIDPAYANRNLGMTWTPAGNNTWNVSFSLDGGTVSAPASLVVQFDENAHLVSPVPTTPVTIQWDDGSSQTLTLDLRNTTQFAGRMTVDSQHNGLPPGFLESATFNGQGALIGNFDNGRTLELFRLPVARFVAPNALQPRNGNLYASTAEAGDMSIAQAGNRASGSVFLPATIEASNVDVGEEFTKMIVTQKAYSSAATVFRTADEMTVLLRDLKR